MGSRDNRLSPKKRRKIGQRKKKARLKRQAAARGEARRAAEIASGKAKKKARKPMKVVRKLTPAPEVEQERRVLVTPPPRSELEDDDRGDAMDNAMDVFAQRVVPMPEPPFESIPNPEPAPPPAPRIPVVTANNMPGKMDQVKERRLEVWSAVGALDDRASRVDLEEYLGMDGHSRTSIDSDIRVLEKGGWLKRVDSNPIRYGRTDKRS